MRRLILPLILLPALAAAQDTWLTLIGDPARADVNTVQVDPVSVVQAQGLRTMSIRVSRDEERTNRDGIRFRSFVGTVEIDCAERTARFVTSQFYDEPLWRSPGARVTYLPTDVRPMAFRGIEPNPRDRILNAACGRPSAAWAGGAALAR